MVSLFYFTYLLMGFILVWRKMPRAVDCLYMINPSISPFRMFRVFLSLVIIWPRMIAR